MVTINVVDELTRQIVGSTGWILMTLKAKGLWTDSMLQGFIIADTDGQNYIYDTGIKEFVLFVPDAPVEA